MPKRRYVQVKLVKIRPMIPEFQWKVLEDGPRNVHKYVFVKIQIILYLPRWWLNLPFEKYESKWESSQVYG